MRDNIQKGERGFCVAKLTNPFQLFPVPMAEQVLQDREQIGDNVEPVVEQADTLVHLEIAPDGLIDGFELGLDPKYLWGVEDRSVEVDVDAEGEELADLHVDFGAGERELAGDGDFVGDFLARFDGRGYELFEEGGLETECAC